MREPGFSPIPKEEWRENDEELFSEYEKLLVEQPYELFTPTKENIEAQKTQFFSGEIQNPQFEYHKIDLEKFADTEQKLSNLKVRLKENIGTGGLEKRSETELINQVYCWKINESIAKIRMAVAAKTGDQRAFGKYCEFVYGKPSPDIFKFITDYTKGELSKIQPELEILEEADRVLEPVLSADLPETSVEAPDSETFAFASGQTHQEIGRLVPELEGGEREFDAAGISEVFKTALDSIGAEGWEVVVDNEGGRTAVSVTEEKKQVMIPGAKSITADKLRSLVAHEIGTHVQRSANGERSRLKLLSLGLDRYDKGEEGVAKLREQVVSGFDFYAPHTLYFATGLAYGLDRGGERRDFRQVYEVMEKYFVFNESKSGANDPTKIKEDSQKKAWNICYRIFRGTDGGNRACFTKDLAYLEGNIGVWDLVKNDGSAMARFSAGKYDPTNDRHVMVMTRLGIGEGDLA